MAYIYRFGGNKKARSAYCKTRKFYIGGLEGNRTLDLCVANAALSQLSYKPLLFLCFIVALYLRKSRENPKKSNFFPENLQEPKMNRQIRDIIAIKQKSIV